MKIEIREAGPRNFRVVCVDEAGAETDLGWTCPHRRAAQRKAERYTRSQAGRELLAERLKLLELLETRAAG